MTYLFPPSPIPALPVRNSDQRIPVRRIYCVGQNYAEHAKEMGSHIKKDAPFFFIKHPVDMVMSGSCIDYPPGTTNLHYELELVAVVGKTLTNADMASAREAVCGFAVGLDLTRRDLQQQLRSQSLPWALSKSFSNSAVISAVNTEVDYSSLAEKRLTLRNNGVIKQDAYLGDMARPVEALLVYLSSLDTLYPGDIIFTGTPGGVGEINVGDHLQGEISGIGDIHLSIK